jgi:hypothetical protein
MSRPRAKQLAGRSCAVEVRRNATIRAKLCNFRRASKSDQCSATRCPTRFTCAGELDLLPRDLIGRNVYELCIDAIIACGRNSWAALERGVRRPARRRDASRISWLSDRCAILTVWQHQRFIDYTVQPAAEGRSIRPTAPVSHVRAVGLRLVTHATRPAKCTRLRQPKADRPTIRPVWARLDHRRPGGLSRAGRD